MRRILLSLLRGQSARLGSITVCLTCWLTAATAQVLLTEVHPTPASGEPEWIECLNRGSRAVRCSLWLVCDSRTCAVLPEVTIGPGNMLVLTSDAEALKETRAIPGDVQVVECRLPSLNNTVDRIELRMRDSSLVDSVTYDMRRHVRGRSLERCGVWIGGTVEYSATWAASARRDSASCGLLNACVMLPHDVRILPLAIRDSHLVAVMLNAGSTTSTARRYIVEVGQAQAVAELPPLDPGRYVEHLIDRPALGAHDTVRRVSVRVAIDQPDDRPENDTLREAVTVPPMPSLITISEIMAEPDERQCEYVELWNGTSTIVDVAGWTLEDASNRRVMVMPPAVILPGAYLAVSADTMIVRVHDVGYWTLMRPSVNINVTSDTVTLRTPEGLVVDRVFYDHESHAAILTTRGRSLERRPPWSATSDRSAWSSSVDPTGGTPGRTNSIGRPPPVLSGMRSWPDPCSARMSSASYPCMISWEQPIEQGIGRLRIFRLDGVQVAELLNGELIGRSGTATWDLRDDVTRMPVGIGSYVAVLECTSLITPEHHVQRCLVNVGQSDVPPSKR